MTTGTATTTEVTTDPVPRRSRSGNVLEPIAHAAQRDEPLGTELASQVPDVDVDHIGTGVEVVAPNVAQHLFTRQYLSGMPQKCLNEREFPRG